MFVYFFIDFCVEYEIAIGLPPTEEDIFQFLKNRIDRGFKFSTMKTLYSHLNSAVSELYGINLGQFKRLYR